MHFIATFCFEVTDSAFNTSEKVPSPSLRTNLYSAELDGPGNDTYYACLINFLNYRLNHALIRLLLNFSFNSSLIFSN
jgi:hypothetical protein